MLHENAEDLVSYFFIGCHVMLPLPVSNRRSHKLDTTASGATELIPCGRAPTGSPELQFCRWYSSVRLLSRCAERAAMEVQPVTKKSVRLRSGELDHLGPQAHRRPG
jgi:hypothetical protein